MGSGIDYGMGTTNVDKSNGIRYGVISQNEVLQAWCDESELEYPDPEPADCDTCGGEGSIRDPDPEGDYITCEDCDGTGNAEDDGGFDDFGEPIGAVYEGDGYAASCSGDSGDIFIVKSPFYTHAKFCSPCAPGAVYLMNPDPDGAKGYCFGHDWFDEGEAPYPVYRVDTGELVPPPSK